MNNHSKQLIPIILAAFAVSQTTLAHTAGGKLAASTSSTAWTKITCFDDGNGPTAYLSFNVTSRTRNATFLTTATVEKNGSSISVLDPVNTDKKPSPTKSLTQGDGTYTLTFSKINKKANQPNSRLRGLMVLSSEFHCVSTTGAHTGTDYTTITNKPIKK